MKGEEKELKKVLSRVDVLFLAIGAMLGWGWVVLSGNWITSAGSMGALIAFVIGGLLVTFVGLTYAELASAMPAVGGEHHYVERAMGHKAAFIVSWAITLGYVSVVTFEAVALPTVIDYLIPNYQAGYLWTLAARLTALTRLTRAKRLVLVSTSNIACAAGSAAIASSRSAGTSASDDGA